MKILLILASIMGILSASYNLTWTKCAVDDEQWYVKEVTVIQDSNIPEVTTVNACGMAAARGWFVQFSMLSVVGSINQTYSWNITEALSVTATTGTKVCLNNTIYIPDFGQKQVNLTWVVNEMMVTNIGCLDITLQKQDDALF